MPRAVKSAYAMSNVYVHMNMIILSVRIYLKSHIPRRRSNPIFVLFVLFFFAFLSKERFEGLSQ